MNDDNNIMVRVLYKSLFFVAGSVFYFLFVSLISLCVCDLDALLVVVINIIVNQILQ